MKYLLYVLSFLFIFNSCQQEKQLTAQQIVDKAIAVSGGEAYKKLDFEFDFRGKHYVSKLENGNFEYMRITKDSITTIDAFGNATPFLRTVNKENVIIKDSLSDRIKNAINSVNYFVLLPFGLNDPAVNKKYLKNTLVKGKAYHKLQVTFNKDGGGADFDDVYIYWISAETFKVDYLAYSFTVNGGGLRFREAYNERYIENIRFVDYKNYKPESNSVTLENLDVQFEKGALKLLSKIDTEAIKVN